VRYRRRRLFACVAAVDREPGQAGRVHRVVIRPVGGWLDLAWLGPSVRCACDEITAMFGGAAGSLVVKTDG